MATLSYLLCLLASSLEPSGIFNEVPSNQLNTNKHKALFVFGDSLFDAGNNQYLNGSIEGADPIWPYGQTFFHHPTGRLSDGRLVPDFIAQFANLPILSPYHQPGDHQFTYGTNFASAGAGVLPNTHPGTISLAMQLRDFKALGKLLREKLGETETSKVLNRAVYLFSIGGNDYFSLFSENPNASESHQRQYVEMVIGNLTSVLKEIYNLGGRKIAFQNAGPLGCLPSIKAEHSELGSKCAELPSSLARQHNRALSTSLNKLQNQLPELKYSIFDYYNALLDRVNYPSKYGFKNGEAACCGSGAYRGRKCGGSRNGTAAYELCSNSDEYVWFDGGHTTEKANLQLATLIWSGPTSVTRPYNVKQLFDHS